MNASAGDAYVGVCGKYCAAISVKSGMLYPVIGYFAILDV